MYDIQNTQVLGDFFIYKSGMWSTVQNYGQEDLLCKLCVTAIEYHMQSPVKHFNCL